MGVGVKGGVLEGVLIGCVDRTVNMRIGGMSKISAPARSYFPWWMYARATSLSAERVCGWSGPRVAVRASTKARYRASAWEG